jgi:hypothetical protein
MNKKFLSVMLVLGMITTVSCSEEKKEDKKDDKKTEEAQPEEEPEAEVAPAMTLNASLDLSANELPFTMQVPEGAQFVQGDFSMGVQLGESFNIEITDFGTTVEERKKEVKENDVNVLKQFVVEEENGFVSEQEVMGQTEYHFFYILKAGDTQYEFENAKGRSYTKEEAMLMFEAAKSAAAK